MGNLTHDDLAAVLDVTLRAYSFDGLASFRAGILTELRRLVPGDVVGYNDLDLATGRALIVFDPPDAAIADLQPRFAATAHQHPGVVLHQQGVYRPHFLSDLVSTRELHRLDLYQEVYRPMQAEDQLYFHLTAPAMVAVAINRSRRSFSQRDRDVIELIEPHLSRAWAQARQRDYANAVIKAQEAGLQRADAAVLVLDPGGSLTTHSSVLARDLLAKYWPGEPHVDRLPEALADWLHATNSDVPNTLTIARGQDRLQVHALSVRSPADWRPLVLHELRADGLPDVESLRNLGITDRQAQVLRLLTHGYSTQKIADELYLSPATIRKHLEHLYTRLGVESRAQAVALALTQK
ncbi:helix-turn-helix transcriptional regulator [Mycobacterium sp.]|uniref:helix-turn-helix transcriptional regulator n=1 Tax=Mycobacterium sp. TaxID=1785 RepID=UPI002D1324DB|nr:helix-turn-helix transcriptional regulator [Mycobacterium sp.]HKP41460.1 helix-turn-helix transcriptional regulator [Mycobacterium sp.]